MVDPRVVHTHRVVRQAALDVLGQVGYAAFTVEAVAERAGVSKSTVYRHWPSKMALITDALDVLNTQPAAPAATGGARAAVLVLVHHLAEVFVDSTLSACIPALVEAAEHHPEVRKFLHEYSAQRRARLVDVLAAGVADGELDAGLDPELASLALSGPIVYRRLLSPTPFDPTDVGALVDLVLGPPAGSVAAGG